MKKPFDNVISVLEALEHEKPQNLLSLEAFHQIIKHADFYLFDFGESVKSMPLPSPSDGTWLTTNATWICKEGRCLSVEVEYTIRGVSKVFGLSPRIARLAIQKFGELAEPLSLVEKLPKPKTLAQLSV